ncbi:MAG TPA: sugar phosphate isomerase/epimerase [Ktedonobacterales bacterium]|jgi:sugar phosphate isomerase/epimerase|nr:sugar phosphate isomerase/epimerase [Ktedonobacterales bacterium]
MRLSFSTGTFYHRSLDYSLRLARDLGFDGVELAIGPEALYLGVAPLRRAIERVGVPVLSVHPPFFPLPGWPRWSTHRIPQMMSLARDLGAELGVTHTINFYDPNSARNAHFSQAIRMGMDAGAGDVALTIENSQYNRRKRMAYLDHLQRLVNYARTRGCGVTFDTCHAGACHEDLLRDYALVRPLLRNVHLNDLVWRDGKPHTHRIPGDGVLDLRPLLERLARDDYAGLVTVELHPREVGLLRRANAERALSQSLDFMRSATAQAPMERAVEQA